jgi:hypothetical protein
MIRTRPKGLAGKTKWATYWPPGDVLNFWPTLLLRALDRLKPEHRPPHLKMMLDHHRISDHVLFDTMRRYIRAMKAILEDPDVKTLDAACAREGFFLCPEPARAAIFMVTGELTAGIYTAGVKNTTPLGENGIRDDVETLVWAAEQHAQSLDDLRR